MRAIWKGAVSFGLVSIPVKLYTATEEKDVALPPGAPQRRRAGSGTSGSPRPTARRCAYARHRQGLRAAQRRDRRPHRRRLRRPAAARPARRRRAAVRAAGAGRPDLLRQELLPRAGEDRRPSRTCCCATRWRRASTVAMVKVAIRNREPLATLRVRDGVIVLETMIWPDEVRDARRSASSTRTSRCARRSWRWRDSLIESMAGDFDPAQYTDDYREALRGGHRGQGRGPRGRRAPRRSSPTTGTSST